MEISKKRKIELFALLVVLNIILRFQVVPNEIGADSVLVHMMVNSISEFGYAKWVLHPNSFLGMYAYSEVSAVPFFLSGICQSAGIEMRWVTFLYCILVGLLSMFAAYLMAGAIMDDDLFKFLAAFAFSTSPAVLGYSTWTIPARGLFVVLAPLLVYMLLKCRGYRYIPLTIFFAVFLYATHHLIYFLLPAFFSFFVIFILFNLKKHIKLINIPSKFALSTIFSKFTTIDKNNQIRTQSKINSIAVLGKIIKLGADNRIGELKWKLYPLILIAGFAAMFSIPFVGHKFIEESVYAPIYESYVRYAGLLIIPAVGGLVYMIFKRDKSFSEWVMLLSVIFLTALIYEQTYMKGFLPIFAVPFMCIGLVNILRSERKRYALTVVSVFLLISLSFSGYYQFLHFLSTPDGLNERYMEDSTYTAGRWMKEYVVGSAISNDKLFGNRIATASETTHHLVTYTLLTSTYGFVTVNLSQFKWYPITSEDFWFDVGEAECDLGEFAWDNLNILDAKPRGFNITYVAENTKAGGDVIWHHGRYPSKLLYYAYDNGDCVYDCGKVNLWKLPAE